VAAVDYDPAALATYKANHRPHSAFLCDIADLRAYDLPSGVDVITGGPPCQGFSGLGAERRDDPRNALWEEYMRIVAKVQPRVFVMENVDRFVKSVEYERLLEAVKPGGPIADYELTVGVLNAADFGVPQARKRAIIVGTHRMLGSRLALPVPTHARSVSASNDLQLFYSPDLPAWVPVDVVFDRSAQMEIIASDLPQSRARTGGEMPLRTDELHFGRTPQPVSLARYKAIPPRGNRMDLRGQWAMIDGERRPLSTAAWDAHNTGSGDVMGRLRLGQPSVTIRTEFFKPEKGRYLHPFEHRPITHFEAALIQGFPEDYLWHGTKIEIARQIGNAIPVGLARALGAAVHKHLTAEPALRRSPVKVR
jgi:DNA (cytosine-5)-methyltransferase 1